MPWYQILTGKRFWACVGISAAVTAAADALGAWLLTAGWVPMENAGICLAGAWLLGGVTGGRLLLRVGCKQRLICCGILNCVTAAVLAGIGAVMSSGGCTAEYGAACAAAFGISAFLAACLGPGRRRRKRKRGAGERTGRR